MRLLLLGSPAGQRSPRPAAPPGYRDDVVAVFQRHRVIADRHHAVRLAGRGVQVGHNAVEEVTAIQFHDGTCPLQRNGSLF